jgi:ribosomal subunit interface protein
MELQIHSVGFSADAKLEEYIDKKISKIEKYHHKIISVDIYLKLENTGQIRDKIIESKIQIPGQTLYAESSHKTFEAACDKLTDTIKRQLKKQKEIIRAK